MHPIPKHAQCEVTTARAHSLTFRKKRILMLLSTPPSWFLLTISEPLDWSQLHPRLLFKTLFLNLSPQKCPRRRTWHALSKIEGWNPSLCALCFCSDLIINWDMGRPRVRHSLEGKEQVGTGQKGRWKEGSHQQSGEWTGRVSEYVAGGPKRERDWGPRRSERELFLQFPSDMEKSS